MLMKRIIPAFLLLMLVGNYLFAQNNNNVCEGALPFCTGTSYSFPAGVNAGNGQSGPNYGCLGSTPNPAWYYMKIALPGMIQITMNSQPAHDIDFCCWGPFDSQNACGQLTSNKIVDCSYSTAATEVCDIANAVQGKYYIMIITNYSNAACNIIFSQTGGAGATDCTILPPAAANNGPLCVGESLQLAAANMNNAVYHWSGPDGWTSTLQNPIRPNVQLSMGGVYSLWVTVNGQPSADTNYTTVGVYNKPTASLSGNADICQGDSTALEITCQNHPPWVVTLAANGQNPVNVQVVTSPKIIYVHPVVNTTYSITQVSNEICNGIGSGSAVVNVNPKPLVNYTYDNVCSGLSTLFSDATLIPGGYAASWHWDFGTGNDTSNIQNPSYVYANGGAYDVHLKVTSDKGCIGQVTKTVEINPSPVAIAGNDISIPYGTYTTLSGSASGGTGSYSYHWEPANLLSNPNIPNPTTSNLSQTTDFTLTVVDLVNNCSNSDIVTVTITGGPMGVQVQAEPQAICLGASANINAQAGGGSGNYSFVWTSNPAGFNSNLEDITVQPQVTTTYNLSISDGFSTLNRSVTITVYPNPVVNPGIAQSIPNGTTTTLSGNASGSFSPYAYSWSPANLVVNPNQNTTLTNILSGTTSFTLTVTDANGCISSEDVLISIVGGPLMVHPIAVQSPLCVGESTRLKPMSEGGSGNYTYSWSAPGFQSSISEPVVTPTQTTTYHLTIGDGFTQNQGDVTVVVNPLPVVNLIPAGAHIWNGDTIMECIFDTITINATNPNATYLWSNGATTPEIEAATSGIAFDMLSYSVNVSNTLTGCHNSGALTIIFTYAECAYGVEDGDNFSSLKVYPNPGKGDFILETSANHEDMLLEVFNIQGLIVLREWISAGSEDKIHLNLTNERSGIYLLRITENDRISNLRLLKY